MKTRHRRADVAGRTRETEDAPVVAAGPTAAAGAVHAVVAGSAVAAVRHPWIRIAVADRQVVTENPNAVGRAAEVGHEEVGRAAVASRGAALRAVGAVVDAADRAVAESRSVAAVVTGTSGADQEVEKRSRERVGAVIKQPRADREAPRKTRKAARAVVTGSRRNARAVRRALVPIKRNVARVAVQLEEKLHQSAMVVLMVQGKEVDRLAQRRAS